MKKRNEILIIEDEHINRELLKIHLDKQYDLKFANSFESGMEEINTHVFDLIITDIRLGGKLDGINLLRKTKQSKTNSQTPVMAYTASESSVNQKSFEDEGFDGFITKPILKAELERKVKTLLNLN